MGAMTGSGGSSYYYPVAQVPNSSYPTVDIRGGGTPDTAAGVGRLYVLSSSNDLYFKDADGNDVLMATSAGTSAGQLSSSTSTIPTSGSLDFSETDKNYHITARNSHLILSSSVGSRVMVSGSSLMLSMAGIIGTAVGALTVQGAAGMILNSSAITLGGSSVNGVTLTTNGGHLILSASSIIGGTVVAFSSSANFVNQDKPWHVRAVNSHLILSSSVGSVVRVSGALYLESNPLVMSGTQKIQFANASTNLFIRAGAAGTSLEINAGGLTTTFGGGVTTESTSGFILNAAGNYNITNIGGKVRNSVGHLILSSTVGSVVKVSGAICPDTVATTDLIAGADNITGSIMWDSTRKALKVYGPEGWTVLATGTTG